MGLVIRREIRLGVVVCCLRGVLLAGCEYFVIDVYLFEYSFQFEFGEDYSDAAHYAGCISNYMIACTEYHVCS